MADEAGTTRRPGRWGTSRSSLLTETLEACETKQERLGKSVIGECASTAIKETTVIECAGLSEAQGTDIKSCSDDVGIQRDPHSVLSKSLTKASVDSSRHASEARWRRGFSASENGQAGVSSTETINSNANRMCRSIAPGSTVRLRSGVEIPILGLGTRGLKPGTECRDVCRAALRCGYKLIDTSPSYNNEEDVGRGIRAACLKREDVFIVTKLIPIDHGELELVEEALANSLRRLDATYVDLFLIQSPKGGSLVSTWNAMVALRSRGLAKAIGVSNFSEDHLRGLAAAGCELPDVSQMELHFGLQQRALVSYCEAAGIAVMAACPLACGKLFPARTDLGKVAARLGRTEAELALRWCLQRGYIVIPKTKDLKRVEANAPFGFVLNSSDMMEIDLLDRGFSACSSTKASSLPFEQVLQEISEVSESDADDGKGERRRRRRRRRAKGKGKGKGIADGKGKGRGAASDSAALRFRSMLISMS